MDAVEAFGALVVILVGVGDRVVALVFVRKIFLDDLVRHARALAGRLAAVIDTVEMEVDADAVREGIGRVVRRGERDPPDRGKVGDDEANEGYQGQTADEFVFFCHDTARCLDDCCIRCFCVHRRWIAGSPRLGRGEGNCVTTYFFLPPAFGLHMLPGMVRLDW